MMLRSGYCFPEPDRRRLAGLAGINAETPALFVLRLLGRIDIERQVNLKVAGQRKALVR